MELGGFAPTYGVELLCRQPLKIPKASLLQSIRKRCPGAAPLDENPTSDLLAFVHPDHPVEFTDTRVPAQTFVATTTRKPSPHRYEPALQQSWNFPDAQQAVARCTTSVLVSDLMSASLPYSERLDLFQRVLLGVVEVVPCEAIHWQPTQQLIDPANFLGAEKISPSALFFAGAINVRFFNVSGSPGEMLMDTLGLAALGLPDLQCRYRDLEPTDVAGVLYNTAWYIFQEGDEIADGHTITGTPPDSKWGCHREESLIDPKREVLNLTYSM